MNVVNKLSLIGLIAVEAERVGKICINISTQIESSDSNNVKELTVKLMVNMAYFESLIISLNKIIKSHASPKYECVGSTYEQKVNWFLDNKIYENKDGLSPSFETISDPNIKIYKKL